MSKNKKGRLDKKVALVTGGIAWDRSCIAMKLAEEGEQNVVINYQNTKGHAGKRYQN